jgi:colanic acid/amylovoran biosynthesis protein
MPKITVGLMGAALGLGNRGVSALSTSLMKLFLEVQPDAHLYLLLGSQNTKPFDVRLCGNNLSIPVVNYRVTPRSGLSENIFYIATLALAFRLLPFSPIQAAIKRKCLWIKSVAEANLVGDIRGGDSFSDIYGLLNFLVSSLPVLTVIWVRGSIVLFPQTYGPFKHAMARMVARYILRNSSIILSRDQEGLETVRNMIGSDPKIRFCPDVAFELDAIYPDNPEIDPPMPSARPDRVVGLNINGLMFNGGYTRQNMFGLTLDYPAFLRQLVETLLADETTHVLLIPHTFSAANDVESDPQASRDLLKILPETHRLRVHLVTAWYDQHQLKALIGGCDFFIGSRMHSCIAALSQGIPSVGVAYSKKFKGVFDSVGAGEWIVDGRQVDAASAVRQVVDLIERRAAMKAILAAQIPNARALLRRTFTDLVHSTAKFTATPR